MGRRATEGQNFKLGHNHAAGAFPFGDVVKYARTLYIGGVLVAEDGQDDVFFRDRRMSLTLDPWTGESLILAYETAIATRLVSVAGEVAIDEAMVCGVFGLDREAPGNLTYCGEVLAAAKRRAAVAAQRSS